MEKDLLIIEPFYGGSHKQLVDIVSDIARNNGVTFDLLTLPAKKWHWRARVSSLCLSTSIQEGNVKYQTLLCSSVLSLAEFVALCPMLARCRKVVYFHENQLVYPVQDTKERDFQYGYNQITTCLAADEVIFNSAFNMKSFLDNVQHFFKLIPDHRPKGIADKIAPKCRVLYFPLPSDLPTLNTKKRKLDADNKVLHVVWPHRWEHDKNPQMFFKVLLEMKEKGLKFKVSVLGQTFSEVPTIFDEARVSLGEEHIKYFGPLKSRNDYLRALEENDVVVSTADHEFFGVAMLEAVACGCLPLCPNRLVYPEIYPKSCLYNTDRQLFKRLKNYALFPDKVQSDMLATDFDVDLFKLKSLQQSYLNLILPNNS